MQADERRACIASSDIFGGLDDGMLNRIAARTSVRDFDAGQTLFQQGDEADGLYCIVSGIVRIYLVHEDGRELTINLLEKGDVIGEIALLDGLSRTASATALSPTRTVFLGRAAFDELMDESPQLARHCIYVLCERVRKNTDHITQSAFLDLRHRLMNLLWELAIGHGELRGGSGMIALKLTQGDVAQMLGVTREAINKQFRTLARDGVVAVEKGHIVIARPAVEH
jgi:CRP/FNR family cyclic AMP-dependent transcriptional regulator